MLNKETIAVTVARIAGSVLLFVIVACSSSSQFINETLDPNTSATVTSNNKPLVFYRDNPSRAAYARDFLQLGPIAINRGGRYRYFLWISAWSTMQDPGDSEQRDRLESIVVFADAEPLNLELAGWTPSAIDTSEGIYVKAVASAVDAYYEVTIDQIRLIAHANNIRISTGSLYSNNYETWDEQKSALESMRAFHDFVAY
jgi:hypothetical protein